jgi:hypothetical protein
VPGQGSNQLPWPVDAPFKHIDPAHEQPGLVYKLIIGGIVLFPSHDTQHNTTQHNTTQHNTTQHNTTQHNKPTVDEHELTWHDDQ